MTKGDAVSFVYNLLSAGAVTDDTEKKYPKPVIEAAIKFAIQDALSSANGRAVVSSYLEVKEKVVNVLETQGRYFCLFPSQPLGGFSGLLEAAPYAGANPYGIHKSYTKLGMMRVLKRANMQVGIYPLDSKIYFTSNPGREEVSLFYCEDIKDLEDDDQLFVDGRHMAIIQQAINLLMVSDRRVMDTINQQNEDGSGATN